MRFIGGKTPLLQHIAQVLQQHTTGRETVFCDIFSGTGAVARHFKPQYEMYTNDLLHFSYIMQKATIENNRIPTFSRLKKSGVANPFAYLEETEIAMPPQEGHAGFITQNYSPYGNCKRMYLTPQNATRIDFIRAALESWKTQKLVTEKEYYYLLACLVEGVPFVSNITGTYGAYLKKWDKRAHKNFEMVRLNVTDNQRRNKCYNQDANRLIKTLEGDILYIDPPYNSRQYAPNYHLLETISRYDSPDITGVTGMRPYQNQRSGFCVKSQVQHVFEELVANARFANILVSYNGEGLMAASQIEAILKKHGQPDTFKLYTIPYRKFKSNSHSNGKTVNEYIFFIQKNLPKPKVFAPPLKTKKPVQPPQPTTGKKYLKSPLNYIGGKYKLLPQILPLFPKNINTFVDLFSGGANVAINVQANKIICNDINSKIIELFQTFQTTPLPQMLAQIQATIQRFSLSKQNEEGFLQLRQHYNQTKNPIDLYTLTCYSYNYQFRFNSNLEYNNPFGRNRSQFSQNMQKNLTAFVQRLQQANVQFTSRDFQQVSLTGLGPRDMLYCDPPYLITTGSYNDGNRGFKDWGEQEEQQLYQLLDKAHNQGIRFALSNVIQHKGKTNQTLLAWCQKYRVIQLSYDYSGASYNTNKGHSEEVLVVNY